MIAVIRTGGKQYKVAKGDKIKIEKIPGKEGDKVVFEEVLLVGAIHELPPKIGQPLIKGAKVEGKIIGQGKGEKKIVFKYKPKKRYRVKKGHRQLFSEVEITKIIQNEKT